MVVSLAGRLGVGPFNSVRARLNDDPYACALMENSVVGWVAIIGSIGSELADLIIDLIQQRTLIEIEGQIAKLDKAILTAHRNDDVSLRLSTIPGVGPVIATCLSASVPDAKLFVGGREFAAWLGLVPRQHSTGGKPRLGSISKMGNRRLRKLLVVGAHAGFTG